MELSIKIWALIFDDCLFLKQNEEIAIRKHKVFSIGLLPPLGNVLLLDFSLSWIYSAKQSMSVQCLIIHGAS